jgi:hypothetical protein
VSLPHSWEIFVLSRETTECIKTASSVNISSKFVPRTQASLSVVAFLYETNYLGVSAICHALVYKGGSARKMRLLLAINAGEKHWQVIKYNTVRKHFVITMSARGILKNVL